MLKQKLRTRFWITWNGSSELFPVLFRFPFMISPNPVWRCLFNEFAQKESQRQWRYGSVCSRKAALYYFSIFPYGKNSIACLYCQQCSSDPNAIYLFSVSFNQIVIVQIYLTPRSTSVCANFGGERCKSVELHHWIGSLFWKQLLLTLCACSKMQRMFHDFKKYAPYKHINCFKMFRFCKKNSRKWW